MRRPFVRLRPRADQIYISQGRTVWTANEDGVIEGGRSGLFVHETRMLSRHRVTVDGAQPHPVALSKVKQHAWMGYYIFAPPELDGDSQDMGSGLMEQMSEQSVEVRISRFVGTSVHEDLDLTNYASQTTSFELAVELDADFADLTETVRPRRQFGQVDKTWDEHVIDDEPAWQLTFAYASHHLGKQLERGLQILVHNTDSEPRWEEGRLCFDITLDPGERWHCCLDYLPRLEEELSVGGEETEYECAAFEPTDTPMDRRRERFLGRATALTIPGHNELTHIVQGAYVQAIQDLASLRLPDLDVDETGWTMAAGLPLYVALFGRDTLTTAWQASILDAGMLDGTLARLAELQGERVDDWRDEQPGRMLHEAHTGPLEVLDYNPRARYYGSITSSAFYPVALCQLWHWTGDKERVRRYVEPALDALDWLDREADLDDDGFYEYLSRSSQGTKHQAWKDSDSAMVYEDGSVAEPPIATCEEQGFVYMAKFLMSELLWWLGDKELSRRFRRESSELKKRFNEAFWMPDETYVAMALDSDNRPLRSISSNPGHCMATGIIDESMAGPIAGRLISDDIFSGWGVRTLSSEHPAYNPYSYHRGSVWPVENATFALGFLRYGLTEHVETLCRAQFESAGLFDSYRLPEVFSGHARDSEHPFPAFYPKANAPQAWSASAIFSFVQAMCGLYPYAPLKMLLVDPHLPDWLPEITLEDLQVGDARVTLNFRRDGDKTTYRVQKLDGTLHVLRQPSPWSLTAGPGERVADALRSLLPGR
ncbi:MAG: glycogen debranching N-terminal domain-containing protein [Persicimonas sp.]